MTLQAVIELQENYEQLKKEQWLDKQLRYVLARSFVGSQHPFSGAVYQQTRQRIKDQLALFNQFSSPVRESIICLLMTHNRTSEQAISQLLEDYDQLINGGFRRSPYTYFAAYLLQFSKTNDKLAIIAKGKEIYQAIKQTHPFLTGEEDAPITISLAQNSLLQKFPVTDITDIMEKYYVSMNKIGFSKGDELQFAAGNAVLLFQGYHPSIIEEMMQMIQQFNLHRLPFRRETYASIVFLTYLSTKKGIDFSKIVHLYEEITQTCQLGFYKNLRTSLAVSLYIGSELQEYQKEEIDLLSLNTNFLLIQQEMAAMIATTTMIAASTSSNN